MRDIRRVWRKLRNGERDSVRVDLAWKPDFIRGLINHFGFEREFSLSEAEIVLDLGRGLLHNRTLSLRKGGWLKRRKLTKAKRKDKDRFQLSEKKYSRYMHEWGTLNAGPLINEKRIEEVEKIVEKPILKEVEKKFTRKIVPKEIV